MRGSNRIKQRMYDLFMQMWNEAHYDKEKGEVISTKEYFMLGVERGEVLKDPRSQMRFDLKEIIKKWYDNQ